MSTIENSLNQATISTFEDLGFLLAEEEPTDEQMAAPVDTAVVVGFDGPCSGEVEIRLSRSVLVGFAANMLGIEPPVEDHLLRDALGEIGNVVCGNALPLIAGRREIFHLMPPSPTLEAAGTAPGNGEGVTVVLGVDEGRAEVTYTVREGEPVGAS